MSELQTIQDYIKKNGETLEIKNEPIKCDSMERFISLTADEHKKEGMPLEHIVEPYNVFIDFDFENGCLYINESHFIIGSRPKNKTLTSILASLFSPREIFNYFGIIGEQQKHIYEWELTFDSKSVGNISLLFKINRNDVILLFRKRLRYARNNN